MNPRSSLLALALVITAGTSASAAPRLLALDDVYACGFAADGTVIAVTAGGLRIGARVVTALEGLPDTRIERMNVEGDHVYVETRQGTARVAIATGLVWDVARGAPGTTSTATPPVERFGKGVVRARAKAGPRSCIATTDGLYVSVGGLPPARVGGAVLPSGDVSALAPGARGMFVGTFDRGLFLFDGISVTAIVDPALNPYINALAYDPTQHLLWVGTARGLVRCEDGQPMRCRRVGDRLAKHALLPLGDGRVLAGGDESLLFVARDGNIDAQSTRKAGAKFRSVWSIARGGDGTIYVGTTSGVFFGDERTFANAPERLGRAAMVRGALPDDWVTALCLVGDELVAGTYNAGIVSLRRVGDRLVAHQADRTLGYVNPGGVAQLPDGRIAVATMDGLRVGRIGDFAAVPTLGKDVTAVAIAGGERWVAARRGVASF